MSEDLFIQLKKDILGYLEREKYRAQIAAIDSRAQKDSVDSISAGARAHELQTIQTVITGIFHKMEKVVKSGEKE